MKATKLFLVHWVGVLLYCAQVAHAQEVKFNRDIRPILSDRCFACHGPDSTKRQSGLRLDTRKGAYEPLLKHNNRRAFVAGDLKNSFAYVRIMSTDPHEIMPPPDSKLKVTDHEKEMIRKWIEQGAKWEDHWAFVKPVRPEVPEVKNKTWAKNDIDRFILARLEQEGLSPSPEADRATWIRRVTLDLIGLPPTPEEVSAFENDKSADAYEKVVDRLMASPHYGEQMAVDWLDTARYADSHGFQSDPERFMWHWRDWVINAYNTNMPFDQFTIKQIAGDLLPNSTDEDKVATGFNRNHRMNSEGGIIDEEWRVETVIDRVETTSTTFLGLTLGCCRCHDHKYDPFTQKDFYSLSAYYNSIAEKGEYFSEGLDKGINGKPVMSLMTGEQKAKLVELEKQKAEQDAKVAAFVKRLPELEKKFVEEGTKVPEPPGLTTRFPLNGDIAGVDGSGKPIATKSIGKAPLQFVDGKKGKALKTDASTTAIDAGQAINFERSDSFSFGAWIYPMSGDGSVFNKMEDQPFFRGIDLYLQTGQVAPHFVAKWPENALKVVARKPLQMNMWTHVMVTYDGKSRASGVKVYYNGKLQRTTTDVDNLQGGIKTTAPLLIGKRVGGSAFNGSVQDIRFYNRVLREDEVLRLAVADDVNRLVKIPAGKRTKQQKEDLIAALVSPLPEYQKIEQAKEEIDQKVAKLKDDPNNTTMIMQELPAPRDTFILVRGQYDKHGEKVGPSVISSLAPLPKGAPYNRLGLAYWLVSDDNPLTARVQVNRFWQKFFGIGLVKTSENFGTQGEWPSHPLLLDWLATEFVRLHWDMKALQREIVLSATYRQSSNVTPELLEKDPDNRLLARAPRLRLPAESVRDQALAVSGLLVDKIGGPSVRPYEPSNLWEGNLFGNLGKYEVSSGADLYRRSMYTFIKRTAAPPNLMAFDMATREFCVVKRSRTNTPLQALVTMNDVQFVEASRAFAEKMMKQASQEDDRLTWAFTRATSRKPTPEELRILHEEFDDQLARYKAKPDDARKLIHEGASKPDEKLDAPELAAYTMTASVILNLDELVTKE